MPIKAALSIPSSAGQGRENVIRSSWVVIRTERDHSAVTVMDKTDSTWGKLFFFQSNQSRIKRNKTKS